MKNLMGVASALSVLLIGTPLFGTWPHIPVRGHSIVISVDPVLLRNVVSINTSEPNTFKIEW